MVTISLIAAVDESNGLGKNNQLLCHLPADLKHFKKETMGKPIIMGRHTFLAINKPLPGRFNLVLSRQARSIAGVCWVHSLEEAIAAANQWIRTQAETSEKTDAKEIMIIGGAQIYQQAFPLASQIYLTRIHAQFEADVFFPNLSPEEWQCVETAFHPKDKKNAYAMTFYRYVKK